MQESNSGLSRVRSWELTLRETLPGEGAGDFSPREDTRGIEKCHQYLKGSPVDEQLDRFLLVVRAGARTSCWRAQEARLRVSPLKTQGAPLVRIRSLWQESVKGDGKTLNQHEILSWTRCLTTDENVRPQEMLNNSILIIIFSMANTLSTR